MTTNSCTEKENCKSAGTGPGCLDKSIPANDGLRDGKKECLERMEKECNEAKVSCMKDCVRREMNEVTNCGTIELGRKSYITRATWACRSQCDRPGMCNYLQCYCLEIVCQSCLVANCDEDPSDDPTTPGDSPDPDDDDDDPGDGSGDKKPVRNKMRITRSNYSVPIETIFGRHAVNGNIIWLGNVTDATITNAELTTGDTSSFVDGVEVSSVREAFVDFALGLGEGVVEALARVWINGVLVLDNTSTAIQQLGGYFGRDAKSTENYRIRGTDLILYRGTAGQRANPYMGGGVAYRDLAYLFFRRYPIAQSGNNFPDIRVEVYKSATATAAPALSAPLPATTVGDGMFTVLEERSQVFMDGSVVVTGTIEPGTPTVTTLTTDGGELIDGQTMVVTPSGLVLAQIGAVTSTRSVALFNPLDGSEAVRFGIAGSGSAHSATEVLNTAAVGGTYSLGIKTFNQEYYVAIAGNSVAYLPITITPPVISAPARYDTVPGGLIRHCHFSRYVEQRIFGRSDVRESLFFVTINDASADAVSMHELILTSSDGGDGDPVVFPHDNALITRVLPHAAWDATAGATFNSAVYDGGEDRGWIIFLTTAGGDKRAFRYSQRYDRLVWITSGLAEHPHQPARVSSGSYPSNTYEYLGASGTIYRLDRRNGNLLTLSAAPNPQNGKQYYDTVTDAIIYRTLVTGQSLVSRVSSRRLSALEDNLGDMVAHILRRCGLEDSEFDTSAISGIPCIGFKISTELKADDIIGHLGRIYMFASHFSNGKLVFFPKTNSSPIAVSTDEIGAGNDDAGEVSPIQIGRIDDEYQVRGVSLTYLEAGSTYMTESVQNFEPREEDHGQSELISTQAILSADYARQLSEVIYYEMSQRGFSARLLLSPRMSVLSPQDYLTFTPAISDLETTWRVARMTTGANFSVEVELRQDTPDKYSDLAALAGHVLPVEPTQEIETPPTLQRPFGWSARWHGDPTNTPHSGYASLFYATAVRTTATFPETALYRSVDGFLTPIGTITQPGMIGELITAPSSPTDEFSYQGETGDFMVVKFADVQVSTQLSNATDTLNCSDVITTYGKNLLFVGKELIQYGEHEIAPDGVTVTFRRLFRGRGQSDVYIPAGHPVGETVVVYNANSIITFIVPNDVADGSPIVVATAGSFNDSLITNTFQFIGDTESVWRVPPIYVERQDTPPTGFFNFGTGVVLYFDFFRRAKNDTEFADDDFYKMDHQSTLNYGVFQGPQFSRETFFAEYVSGAIYSTRAAASANVFRSASAWRDPISSVSLEQAINQENNDNRGDLTVVAPYNPVGLGLTLVMWESTEDIDHAPSWLAMAYWAPGTYTPFARPTVFEVWRPDPSVHMFQIELNENPFQ
jgi:Putative phage tail protein